MIKAAELKAAAKDWPAERREAAGRFLVAVRGLPTDLVARAMNLQTFGTDWRGCSKGHMAEQYGYQFDPVVLPGFRKTALHRLDLQRLRADAERMLERRPSGRA